MDKDQTEDQTDDHVKPVQDESLNEEMIEDDQDDQALPEQTVVVKKSGGALSLMLSIVALGVAGYLIYQDWQAADTAPLSASSLPEIQQLQQANQSLLNQLTEANSETQQLKAQLNSLQGSLSEVKNLVSQPPGEVIAFDNSENERLLQKLEKQLADQEQSTNALKQQITNLPTDAGVQELSPAVLTQLQNAATVQTLLTTQTLLDTGQVEAAGSGLDRYLLAANLSANVQQKLQNLSRRIKLITLPDAAPLRHNLQSLSQSIKSLALPMDESTDEGQWYDRFISVKKISDDSGLNSSVQLMELKVQLDRLLYQAGLNLTMQQQTGWQSTLNQAANLVQQQLPQQQAMITQLQDLAGQQVSADVPADLNIGALVNELKGMKP